MVTMRKRAKEVKEKKKTQQKRVSFTLSAPDARNVYVVGDFNGWNTCSHPLKKDSKGKWKITLSLIPGRYEYRFLVDDQWKSDQNCSNFAPNDFGGENCVINLK